MSPAGEPVGVEEVTHVVETLEACAANVHILAHPDIYQAIDTVKALAADRARLEAERDGLRKFLSDARDEISRQYQRADKAEAALAESAAREAELREGLELFAARANRYDPETIGDSCELWQLEGNYNLRVDLTVGDLRRARALLAARRDEVTG